MALNLRCNLCCVDCIAVRAEEEEEGNPFSLEMYNNKDDGHNNNIIRILITHNLFIF